MASDDGLEVPTVAEPNLGPRSAGDSVASDAGLDEPPESWLGGLAPAGLEFADGGDHEGEDTLPPGDGLQSQVLLARARSRLLGWDDKPVQIGRYRILEAIGTGGMGVVWSAHDDELDRPVAIKVLRRELAPGSAGRQRLLREAQATAKLSHPNVVHVYEVGQSGEQVFMAMELVRGVTLREWRKAAQRDWREIVEMYVAAGEGLVAAHAEGIVHRDFKPDNVLVNHAGRPQIVDFGLARATHDTGTTTTREMVPTSASGSRLRDFDITRTGTVVGTPAYMAPEQLARAEPDARSDQFSFCASLFEALYGRRPFSGSTYTELERSLTRGQVVAVDRRNEVPRAIHAAVVRGLRPEPEDRFATMRDLIDALAAGQRDRTPLRWILGGVAVASLAVGVTMLPRAADTATGPVPTAQVIESGPTDPWAEIVAASDLPPLVPTPLAGDPAGVTVHRLRNGLTIYVARRPHEPVVASALVLRAGPAQEGPEQPGLAALTTISTLRGTDRIGALDPDGERPLRVLQHALLERLPEVADDPAARKAITDVVATAESTSARSTIEGELFTAISSLGGRDPVVLGTRGRGPILTAEVPRHRVGAWMQLHAEAVQRPVFREFLDTIATQHGFFSWYMGDGAGELLRKTLGESTGIGHDREGSIALLERIPLAEVRAFHHTYWRPNNAALVLVGDISPPEAVSLAEQAFGGWEPAPIPAVAQRDGAIPGGRVALEVEDFGPEHLEIGFPMPPQDTPEYDGLVSLSHALAGRSGLLHDLLGESVGAWGAHVGHVRDFNLFLMPETGQSAEQAEQLMMDALTTIAEDRVDDDAWPDALGEARYEQLAWARGPGTLMLQIADSYLAGRPWSTGPGTPAAAAPTREEIVAAARTLLSRGRVVVRKKSGKAARMQMPAVPPRTLTHRPPRSASSPFVREILATPTTPTEPRFLVEGSHFETSTRGAGRVVTVETDSPLFRLSWIYPVGTSEDPFACDALRGRMRTIPVTGAEIMVFCTTTDTRYEVTAAADRFDELMPPLLAWFDGATADPVEAQEYAEHVVKNRVEMREQAFLRATAAEYFGLLGDAALDRQLPTDAELLRHGGASIVAAFERMRGYDADVLYAGPDPEALRGALPPGKGATLGGPYVRKYRRPQAPEVLFIEDPHREKFSVRASLPWSAATPREHLAATLHRDLVVHAQHVASLPPDTDAMGYGVAFSPGPPIAIGIGFDVPGADVGVALDTALSELRARPSRETFDLARARIEIAFRVDRTAPSRIPQLVHSWGPDATDPRVAQWLALPSLGYDDVMTYYDRIADQIPVLVVCGRAEDIDLDALRRFGRVVRVQPEDVLNDYMISGFGHDMPLLIDE